MRASARTTHERERDAAIASAVRTVSIEQAGLTALAEAFDNGLAEPFAEAIGMLLALKGRVIVTGVGKSGHIGSKIAATLASTGTPAFFVHPAEANHGDLGMIARNDIIIAMSWSGESFELKGIVGYSRRFRIPLIAITAGDSSALAKQADVVLMLPRASEACPHGLAPTTSTLLQLAIGDALAVALLEARGFTPDDFARSHPGGTLGRKLLLHVADVMRTGDALPIVSPAARLAEGLVVMSKQGLGMCVIVDGGRMLGVFTDGDLRRVLDRQADVHRITMREVMNSPGKSVKSHELAAEAAHLMEKYKITALPVIDDAGALVGALNVHDLLRAGVL